MGAWIDELDTKGRGEKRDRATQAGLWEKKAAEQAGEGGNGEKQEHADADNGPAKSGGVPGDTGGLGVSSSAETGTGTGTGEVPGDSGVQLRAVVAEEDGVASSVPSWAEVASDGEQKAQQDAVWELKSTVCWQSGENGHSCSGACDPRGNHGVEQF